MRIASFPFLLAAAWLLAATAPAAALSTGRLPGWVCGQGEPPLFFDGFESGDALHREPTHGSGGAYPGAQTRSVTVQGQPRDYYLYIPTGYPFAAPAPLLLVLHGAGGAGTAPTAAQWMRDEWSAQAQAGGFLVAAPVASGSQGGWLPSLDYPMFQAILNDVAAHYDIDLSRIHGWGYSAGGHVMHDLALRQRNGVPDIRTFAGYGISAGVLQALVCTPATCPAALAQVARKVPVDLRVGTEDYYYPHVQADRDAFLAAGWVLGDTLSYGSFPEGHLVYPWHFVETWDFLCPFQRRLD